MKSPNIISLYRCLKYMGSIARWSPDLYQVYGNKDEQANSCRRLVHRCERLKKEVVELYYSV